MNTYEFEDRTTHLETYEWDDIWWEQTQRTDAKRILYIGDSISRGTRRLVTKLSEETILCDGYATSKGLDNPYLLPTLHLFASQEKKRDAVLFNNGLHGWNLDEESDYPLYYEKVVQGLLKEFPDTPIVLVLTTHIKSPSRDPRVQKRNEAAKAIAEKYSIPVLDFYRLTVENVHLRGEDGVHYAPEGYELMAKAVIDCVNAL